MTDTASQSGSVKGVVAIGWGYHRRLDGICRELGIRYVPMKTARTGLLRWLELTTRTVWLLLTERPTAVIAQNPSLVLSIVAVLLARVLRYRIVIDAHNEAVQPFIHDGRAVRLTARWILRAADVTLVTNGALARFVEEAEGRPLVLHDPLPVPLPPVDPSPPRSDDSPDVVVISTFAPDEPLAEIFAAAAELDGRVSFAVTGRVPAGFVARTPPNVRLTGFLSEQDYWRLLRRASVVVDLTRMPYCLVCGAYEALALGKPMVLTEDPAVRELFGDAVTTVRNEASAIAEAVLSSIEMRTSLGERVDQQRTVVAALWEHRASELALLLGLEPRQLAR